LSHYALKRKLDGALTPENLTADRLLQVKGSIQMNKRTYIVAGLILTALVGASALRNFSARPVSAQKADENFGVATEFNARDEFSNTQNPNGVWSYGYSTSDADNTLNLFAFPNDSAILAGCGGGNFEIWRINNGDQIPQVTRHNPAANCLGIPANALFMHPGYNNQRAVTRWTAPAAGIFRISGSFQKQNPNATTDLKIIKNAAAAGESTLFTGTIGTVYQQAFNFSVTVAAGDRLDFSVGDDGNNTWQSDGSSIVINIGQPVTACLTAPANLQVNVPAENSPSDVQSPNTAASLAGDATYANIGKVGRAFEFDGSGDYVRLEDSAAQRPATAVTAEGWFKFDNVSGLASLISKPLRGSALNSYTLYLEGGQLRGLIGNGAQYTRALSSFVPQTGVWHHLAFTYELSGGVSILKLYANGADVTSGVDGTANLPLFYDANPFPLLIGGEFETNNPQFFLDGQADEVSIYGRALSPGEIFGIAQAGSFGKCAPAACVQPPNDLASWFAGEQHALDSRSNNHGTLQGGAAFANGKVGNAFGFDGVDDYVQTPINMTPQTTIEAWVNPSILTGGYTDGSFPGVTRRSIAGAAADFADFSIGLYGGKFGVLYRSPSGVAARLESNVVVQTGVWYHVSATIDGTTARLYVNGNLEASGTTAANYTPHSNFRIGSVSCCAGDNFGGLVDEIGVYNRALTATEISSIYSAGSSGKCRPVGLNPAANLVGFWTGDGDARDFAGLDQNGTNNGAGFAVGKVGQSFRFAAEPQNISIPDSAAMRPANFTIESWAKSESNSGVRHIFAKTLGSATADSYVLWNDSGMLNAAICANVSTCAAISAPMFNTGEWHHVAVTFDDAGDSLRLYVDGAQVAAGASALSIGYDAHPVLIGADHANEVISDSWRGQLDEVSFYDRALSASEIAAVYNAGAAGKLKAKTVNALPPLRTKEKSASFVQSLLAPATVQLSDATVTFANLTSGGTVSENGIDLGGLPKLPANMTFTGLAYDISTTAGYQNGAPDDVEVCFNVPALFNVAFSNLRVLHLENGAWSNRTAAGSISPNLCTDNLTSLSPFVIVQSLAPSAANVSVSGRLSDTSGTGIGGVSVTLTDSQGRSVFTKSNNFGRYSFANVRAGDVYTVSVSSKRYRFGVSAQAVNVQAAVENVDFIADSAPLGVDSTRKAAEDVKR
jgi:hypothetical protein